MKKRNSNQGKAGKPRKQKQYPRLYSCTQQNAISVSKLIWGYCLALIARFALFSDRFTAEYVAAKIKQADDANALPNNEQRTDGKKTAHVELIQTNLAVCLKWQQLKQYIRDAFPKSLLNIKLEAAGQKYYGKAASKQWDFTLDLIKDAKQFMVDFATELEANMNMPKGFPTEFATAATAFETERNRFVGNTSTAKDGTSVKDKAIYEVELEISKLMAVAKVIFDKEPDNLRKFTYASLIKEVRGNEPAGVKGYLTDAASSSKGVSGVMVSAGDYSTTSDENGRYELKMASGTYNIKFEKPGFQTFVLEARVVMVGVMGRFSTELQEEQPSEAKSMEKLAATGGAGDAAASDSQEPSASGQ
ncbi:MAG: carboxypeptidase regulatory-like domain-containing protein [Saprospiraceae bacterium]|nr:carboxypeptidase regulatory-like domain-containing protein [Saprospiraceae bacterium]